MLQSCGVDSDDGAPVDTPTEIHSFGLEGNIDPLLNTVRVLLSPNINNNSRSGLFNLLWDLSSSDPFSVEVYFNSGVGADSLMLDILCGSDNTQYNCDFRSASGAEYRHSCAFTFEPEYVFETNPTTGEEEIKVDPVTGDREIDVHHYYLRCAQGHSSESEVEITEIVMPGGTATFPVTGNIYLIVCNGDESSCIFSDPAAVEFYDVDPT